MNDLFENQITLQGINEQIATGSGGHDDANVIENQPLNGGDTLGLDGREVRAYGEARSIGIGPAEHENCGSVRERERMGIDCAEKIGIVYEPSLLAGANFC